MIALDAKFAKVVALWRSTPHAGEKASARARAEAMAAAAGMTLDKALAIADTPPKPASILDGFDDFCEAQELGYKAKRAAEKREKERQRLERRAAILSRYGSEEAALAPCGRERILRAALGSLVKPCEAPWQRWTSEVDGYRHFLDKLPDRVRDIIAGAIPLPRTFTAAKAEFDYWTARRDEIEDVLGPDGFGDSALDLIADIRCDMVRKLVEHQISTTTLDELHARFAVYRELECHDEKIEEALFRDLTTIIETRRLYAQASTPATTDDPSTNDRNGRIRAALDADPSRSDRDIARSCRCSPTTVGKVRTSMGLSDTVRAVRRGEQSFRMKFDWSTRP